MGYGETPGRKYRGMKVVVSPTERERENILN
jgi:hypothetical protein